MILGDIRHYEDERHLYPSSIRKGIDCILKGNFEALEPGKYEIDGSLMFVLIQDMFTQPDEELRYESHATYVDIQYLISGEERIGLVKLTPELQVAENAIEERDVVFYKYDQLETSIVLKPGQFAVFYPSDVHRPCCALEQSEKIKKIVVKIHKKLWQLS
jgi:biofilm protein TabA